jgi:hypothetical protein
VLCFTEFPAEKAIFTSLFAGCDRQDIDFCWREPLFAISALEERQEICEIWWITMIYKVAERRSYADYP